MTRTPTYDFTTIRVERIGAVLKCVIDNPASEMNVVDGALHDDLTALFRDLRDERQARAILLTGSKRAFCAGGDFKWFPTLATVGRLEALRQDATAMIWDLLEVRQPIVCALNGHAMGLGASLALLCDSIVMADTARIADPHVRVGIVAGDGGTAIWPLALGPALAKRYLLTGDPLDAATALRLGLVTDVVPSEELMAYAMALTQRLADGAPLAIQYTKAAVNKLVKDALNTAFDHATSSELVTFLSDDHREALAAIAEKRPPRFSGA